MIYGKNNFLPGPNLSKKDWLAIGFIILASYLFALICSSPLVEITGGDREIFRYAGMLLSKSYMPYVDVFDNKPPLIYFAAYGGGWWHLWLVNNTAITLSAVVFYIFIKKQGLKAALATSFVYILLLRVLSINLGGGFTYELSASFSMITACLALCKKPPYFSLGILCAAILFAQVNDVLGVIPLIAYAVFAPIIISPHRRLLTFIKSSGKLLVGFCAFTSLIVGFFAYHHALHAFIYNAFTINFELYIPHHSIKVAISNLLTILKFNAEGPFIAILIFANLSFLLAKKMNPRLTLWTLLFLASLVFDIIDVSISGLANPIYFITLQVYLSFYLLILLNHFYDSLPEKWVKNLIIIFIMSFFTYFLHSTRHHTARILHFLNTKPHVPYYKTLLNPYENLVSDVRNQDGQLYIYQNYWFPAGLYMELNVKAPTRWTNFLFWSYPSFDQNNALFFSIITDINSYHTKYIMDFSLSTPFRRFRKADNEAWQTMLNQHYQKAKPLYCTIEEGAHFNGLCGWLYVRKN
ncbi:MAG: hypothetical protein Q7V63_03175 [Gammaproteobacteria bacterium]|nr:hypothetical protein [Gammaproteobacteria bacterium]